MKNADIEVKFLVHYMILYDIIYELHTIPGSRNSSRNILWTTSECHLDTIYLINYFFSIFTLNHNFQPSLTAE